MRLIVESEGHEQEYQLREGITLIGRDPACDIRVTDLSLSRRHLKCTLQHGELVVKDLNSKNGLYLGSQRIEEAHILPGFRLRAGTVWLRFEQIEQSDEPRPVPAEPLPESWLGPAAVPDTLDELEPAVPTDENFEEDEEPTPLDESMAQSLAADSGGGATRLIVRGDRWFVQDTATGMEVEIVPRETGTAPSPAQPAQPQPVPTAAEPIDTSRESRPAAEAGLPALISTGTTVPQLPARPAPAAATPVRSRFRALLVDRRKVRLLLITTVALIAVIALAVLLFMPEEPSEPLTGRRYRELADQAVAAFEAGNRDEAIAQLNHLQKQPAEGRQRLAAILLDAFATDGQAQQDFRKARKDVLRHWEEVRDSPESTEPAQELARARLNWIVRESSNMYRIDDAQAARKEGKLAESLSYALQVKKDSLFWKEAETLVESTVEAVVNTAATKAAEAEAARNWAEAIAGLEEIQQYREYYPELAAAADLKIASFQKYQEEQAVLERARALAAEAKFDEAIAQLAEITPDGPYAADAAALKDSCTSNVVVQHATNAYNLGNGQEALNLLETAGQKNSDLYRKIQAVLSHREKADQALAVHDFAMAVRELETIRQIESAENNHYAQNAKRDLDSISQLRARAAQTLMTEAEAAVRERKFKLARANYQKVLDLDPASRQKALEELENLRKDANKDYNLAVNTVKPTDPELAMKMLEEVKDRVSVEDKLYRMANDEIREITLELNKKEGDAGE